MEKSREEKRRGYENRVERVEREDTLQASRNTHGRMGRRAEEIRREE